MRFMEDLSAFRFKDQVAMSYAGGPQSPISVLLQEAHDVEYYEHFGRHRLSHRFAGFP